MVGTEDDAVRSLESKQILVTGAGGFIGSHLTEHLVSTGAKVRALVEYNRQGRWGWLEESSVADSVEVSLGDVRDPDFVENVVSGVDVVFHLAALIGIPYSYEAPSAYVQTNVNGTLNVLRAAARHEVERLVHTSTSEVYGSARYVPIDEEHPLQAQSPYAASKIAAEKLVESFYHSFDLPAVTVRPFNTFGPRQSARAVIPTIISQCLTQETVQLGNTFPTRDFNYVTNTVEGMTSAAVSSEAIGQTLNLGSDREISIGDLAELVIETVGGPISIEADDSRKRPSKSEVDRLRSDSSLAREILGWSPRVDLEEGLERTLAWMRTHLDDYKPGIHNV